MNLPLARGLAFFIALCSTAAAYATDLALVGDAHVNATRTTVNYGASSNLYVGNGNTTYVQFNTSVLPAGTTSSQVTKATLLVYVNRVNASAAVSVNVVTSAWAEGTITYATRPSTGALAGTFTPVTLGSYVAVDVTGTVQGWIAGTTANNGLALSSASADVVFDSKENDQTAHPARLDVTLATTPVTVTGGAISYGTGSTGLVSVNNANPQAPVISATLPLVVQSLAGAASNGNTTASVAVDNTTTPATPRITVNFAGGGAATGTTFPNVELATTVTTAQNVQNQGTTLGGDLLVFSATNNANATLTGGNTWDGSTFTVGSSGAGAYEFTSQLRNSQNVAAAILFYLDKNGANTNGSPQYLCVYDAPSQAYSTERNISYFSNVLFLAAGDKIRFYGQSTSPNINATTSTEGASYLTITRFK